MLNDDPIDQAPPSQAPPSQAPLDQAAPSQVPSSGGRGAGQGLGYDRLGSGEPLLLLHGIGSERGAWLEVSRLLARHFDVIAVDLPGFGASAPLSPPAVPVPPALAGAVAGLLDALGLDRVHVAGNSLGGWVGLELARSGRVRTLTLLSPAGLWTRGETPWNSRLALLATYRAARLLAGQPSVVLRSAAVRTALSWPIYGRPWRQRPEAARAAVAAMAGAPGFMPTFRALRHERFTGGQGLDLPIRVWFGSRDRILLAGSARDRRELPPRVTVEALDGCGHVPMTDDPELVARAIIATARATS